MKNQKRIGEKPAIEEMLEDPLVALLMRRDGLAPGDVRAVWLAAASRLRQPSKQRSATETVIEAASIEAA